MCIAIVCQPSCDVINFEINLIFLIKPLLLHGQKVKNVNILRTKIAFIILKELSVADNCLRPESASLKTDISGLLFKSHLQSEDYSLKFKIVSKI